jgi:hypothetical protein
MALLSRSSKPLTASPPLTPVDSMVMIAFETQADASPI